jgi:hypothetical protein
MTAKSRTEVVKSNQVMILMGRERSDLRTGTVAASSFPAGDSETGDSGVGERSERSGEVSVAEAIAIMWR